MAKQLELRDVWYVYETQKTFFMHLLQTFIIESIMCHTKQEITHTMMITLLEEIKSKKNDIFHSFANKCMEKNDFAYKKRRWA